MLATNHNILGNESIIIKDAILPINMLSKERKPEVKDWGITEYISESFRGNKIMEDVYQVTAFFLSRYKFLSKITENKKGSFP